jgi:hypothetical protein
VGITYRPPRQKITITVVVEAEALLAQPAAKRENWLDDQASVKLKLPAKAKKDLKDATTLTELCVALDKKLSPHTPNSLPTGSLILQPTAERRRSGSHYTPRALSEPIVAEAFRPWLERCNHQPTAEQILALKVCDPAMGSGAFLVAVCRFLAGWLVQAWEHDGYPDHFRQEWDKDTVARRLVAQRCLYGVDKNPFAVNLAKLSLWLVTLSDNQPFTFVDHALKCGDSLVGYSVAEIRAAMAEVQLGFLDAQNNLYEQMGIERRESFGFDSLSDADYDSKKQRLEQQIQASEGLRQAGDLIVAAFFAKSKPKERADKQQVYLAMLSGTFHDDALAASVQEIREQLAAGEKGITPFHWDLEFPEVFGDGRGGFDVFVGNPPFAGKNTIAEGSPAAILDWFKQLHPESHGNADLVAHFFRCCFHWLRPGGSLGLIATNTIAQGDTRSTGLRWICLNGGTIYAARKRYKWPGVAAVVVSVVHLFKGAYAGVKLLERRPVEQITAFLFANGGHDDPKQLAANAGKSFQGSIVLGMGFTFDDSGEADDDTPGIPSPIATMKRLIAENPKNAEVIFPYIGGEEVNSSPTHAHHRYVISFGERSEEECRREWPELMGIVERKVKPDRAHLMGRNAMGTKRATNWWIFGGTAKELYAAIAGCERVLAATRHQLIWELAFVSPRQVFSEALVIFALEDSGIFASLQSSAHEVWAEYLGSTMGSADALRYTPTDCFETFPFPLLDNPVQDPDGTEATSGIPLRALGKDYHKLRARIMGRFNEGLTSVYTRFHDPSESHGDILRLRELHAEMDKQVLDAYDWGDLYITYGFAPYKLDLDDDILLPEVLQEQIESGEIFFSDPNVALDFQGQLQAYGAISGRRKLPWRYRWPDAVRDDVLARLLALNAERYEEEVAMGLHSKGAKKPTGGKRGRKPKGTPAKEAPSFQLEPEPLQMNFDLSGGR